MFKKCKTIVCDTNDIYFCQSTVNGLDDRLNRMKKNKCVNLDGPIDVVRLNNKTLVAIDNTRLLAAHLNSKKIEANIHDFNEPLPSELRERFRVKNQTPQTWGEACQLRAEKQNNKYKKLYNPSGSYHICVMS